MPRERIKLCDACHKREAICHVREGADGRMRSLDLYNQCFEDREPAEQKRLHWAAQAAKCRYCGRGPCVEWNSLTNVFAVIVVGNEPTGFLCESCTDEYNRFLVHEMEGLPRDLSEAEESVMLERLPKNGDKHMLEWVAKKR